MSAASTSGPSKAARATTARRRTAALSSIAARIAGRPASAPIDPNAATAASRTRASEWLATRRDKRSTTWSGWPAPRSPSAHAPTSTTVVSRRSRIGRSSTSGTSIDSSIARRTTSRSGSAEREPQVFRRSTPPGGPEPRGLRPARPVSHPRALGSPSAGRPDSRQPRPRDGDSPDGLADGEEYHHDEQGERDRQAARRRWR